MAEQYNLRNITWNMLMVTLEQGGFSHVVLNETLAAHSFTAQERKFVTHLFQGTLEKVILLDAVLNRFSKTATSKMKPLIRNLLRLSVYQLLFMDAVPDRAVLSEAQKLLSRRKLDGLKPFVNGVLRSISRQKDGCLEGLSEHEKNAVPKWLYDLIRQEYASHEADCYFSAVNGTHPHTTVRLLGPNKEETIKSLLQDGCEAECIEDLPAVRLSGFDSLTQLEAFRKGRILPQDLSSILASGCIRRQDFSLGENGRKPLILDVCAAPGGKSIGLADLFPEAQILSMDVSENKISLMQKNLERTGIQNIKTLVHDARTPLPEYQGKADAVICDLPCSGLGVIGRKPDIRVRLKQEDIAALADLQKQILTAASAYVKPGGTLLYSTCTVTKEENEDNALWFAGKGEFSFCSLQGCVPESLLSEKQKSSLEKGMLQLLNGVNGMDGFFVAKFKKKGRTDAASAS